MRELRHPSTHAIYGIDPQTGMVRIEDHGRVGLYTWKGEWRSGDIFDVDPEMCVWIGGSQLPLATSGSRPSDPAAT